VLAQQTSASALEVLFQPLADYRHVAYDVAYLPGLRVAFGVVVFQSIPRFDAV